MAGVTYELGKVYVRPCVRACWPVASRWSPPVKPRWIPVLGPQHADVEFIGFPHQHFHVDWRFLDAGSRRRADFYSGHLEALGGMVERKGPVMHEVHRTPVTSVTPDWPEGVDARRHYMIEDEALQNVPKSAWFRWKRFTAKAVFPDYEHSLPSWLGPMYDAYEGAELKGLVCPHRGASLEGLEVDSENCVTCPLHGLRWSLDTGRIARPPVPLREPLP